MMFYHEKDDFGPGSRSVPQTSGSTDGLFAHLKYKLGSFSSAGIGERDFVFDKLPVGIIRAGFSSTHSAWPAVHSRYLPHVSCWRSVDAWPIPSFSESENFPFIPAARDIDVAAIIGVS